VGKKSSKPKVDLHKLTKSKSVMLCNVPSSHPSRLHFFAFILLLQCLKSIICSLSIYIKNNVLFVYYFSVGSRTKAISRPIDLWLSHAPSTHSDTWQLSCHSRRHFTGGNWWFLVTERLYTISKSKSYAFLNFR